MAFSITGKQAMFRQALTLAGFFAAGCLAVVGYSRVTRVEPALEQPSRPLVTASLRSSMPPSSAPGEAHYPASEPAPSAPAAASPPTSIDKWVMDAVGEDANARSAAISALARVPKDAALPALKKVLTGGDPAVDRPLALESLQTLALEQGDEDGRVKDLLRQAVTHSDDEKFAEAAQRTLDSIP